MNRYQHKHKVAQKIFPYNFWNQIPKLPILHLISTQQVENRFSQIELFRVTLLPKCSQNASEIHPYSLKQDLDA